MDVVKAIETYVNKLVAEPSAMKVLLLDTETTPIVSLVTTQSTLLAQQIYLTDRIDNRKRDRLPHMKCICLLRPSQSSLASLADELAEPRYGEYFLYFTNVLTKVSIERIAEADKYQVVKEVQEYFADYSPILPDLFSLNYMPSDTRPLFGSNWNTWNSDALERSIQGLLAVLLSLKKKPIIRYERMSAMAKRLGTELQHRMELETALFDFRLSQTPPLLLIVDRRNDPVTPLLSQWTYQAMVHELLGINNGRVNLSMVPDVRPEMKEIILTRQTDPFFEKHHLASFGELGSSLKDYVQSYQKRSASHQPSAINSITDMKRFVEEYPEFQKLGGNVSKHVTLVGELSRLVDRDLLLEVGECEQGLATTGGQDVKVVKALLANNAVPAFAKLRLVMLYALRYQRTAQAGSVAALIETLVEQGLSGEDARLVYALLNAAGADHRQDDLFSNETLFSKGRSVLKGLKGVENVYTQHSPHLSQTLEHLVKGRLRDISYPFLEGFHTEQHQSMLKAKDIIVFMIGGTTYEEARTVSLFNYELAKPSGGTFTSTGADVGTRILLGGSCIHSSSSFIEMLSSAANHIGASAFTPPLETGGSAPALNLQLGGLSVNVGGTGGTGIYRTSGEGHSFQAEGIRDGVKNLIGNFKLPGRQ